MATLPPAVRNDLVVATERLTRNRLALADLRARMVALRDTVVQRRQEIVRRRAGLGQRLEFVKQGLATARTWCPSAPVRRRPQRHAGERAGVARLHEIYASARDPKIRDQLMASYDGLARALAVRFRRREALDDLVQVARIGLLQAITRFDPSLGHPFPVFARQTINGELKRHMRDRTWTMRVPRGLQEDYLTVMATVEELTAEYGESPPMTAISERCGLSIERVVEALELRSNHLPLSLDAPAGPDVGTEVIAELGQEDLGYGRLDDRQLVADLLGRLPDRDRRILELRFIDELTQAEIAAEIGVSQMCVSRVLARTLGRLRYFARSAVA
jgi:RNA polymerase sigma-B factor